MANRVDQRFRLDTGRVLGLAQYGDPVGRPVLYCHGFPASRLEGRVIDAAAKRQRARIIAVDRPGYGLSYFQAGRRLTDWPDDLGQLADGLGIERFAVLGISGGGPYALSCAWKHSERVTAVSVVCGLGPVYQEWASRAMPWPGRLGFSLARRQPWLLNWVYGGLVAQIMRWRPELIRALLTVGAPATDRVVLARPDISRWLLDSSQEALRQGPRGILQDFVLYANAWGFLFQQIPMPVGIWHGGADMTVPPSHAQFLAQALPRARLQLLAEEGHFSLPINFMDDILGELLGS
ncbi:MAG: alpha/beta fold hydrolase [Gammaproteobacteria bacterium]